MSEATVLYHRPAATYQTRDHIRQAAAYMVRVGWAADFQSAIRYLLAAQYHAPQNYKAVIAAWYRASGVRSTPLANYMRRADVNNYRSSTSNQYGDSPHQWYV